MSREEAHPHHISPVKVILILLLLAAVIIAVALAGYLPRKERVEAANAAAEAEKSTLPSVTSAKVVRAPEDTDILLPGTISPVVEASIYARATGYVKKRYADFGDKVTEGQLMAEIEAPELDQQVAQARASLAQVKQQFSQAQAAQIQAESQRDLAKVTSERYNKLVERGAVARQDADTQTATYKTANALVEAQKANVAAAQENVQQAQANLDRVLALADYKSVRAPFAGIVTARNVEVGSLISATGGGQGASPMNPASAPSAGGNEMFRVAQTGVVRILENVPQASAPGIQPGLPADVTVTEFPGRKFEGKVVRTSNALDATSRTMLVEVQVVNRDGRLLPGMYAEVRFRYHRESPPLLVPGDALIAGASGMRVAVLTDGQDGSRKVHIQPVTTGRDYGAQTEILAGLQGGETVVVNPGDDVREGALVRAQLMTEGRGAGRR
jgi:multidrug efflux pump subunit AcrA (membrane-fusion protein)